MTDPTPTPDLDEVPSETNWRKNVCSTCNTHHPNGWACPKDLAVVRKDNVRLRAENDRLTRELSEKSIGYDARISQLLEDLAEAQNELRHGPKIGSVLMRGDPYLYLQIVNTYIKDGHLVVVVDPGLLKSSAPNTDEVPQKEEPNAETRQSGNDDNPDRAGAGVQEAPRVRGSDT